MENLETPAIRDRERIIKAHHAVCDAQQKYESLKMDNALSEMIAYQLLQAQCCTNNAYGLINKLIEQEKWRNDL